MSTPISTRDTANQQQQGSRVTPPSAVHGERVGVALPSYLTEVADSHLPDAIIADSWEELVEEGDGGDSGLRLF